MTDVSLRYDFYFEVAQMRLYPAQRDELERDIFGSDSELSDIDGESYETAIGTRTLNPDILVTVRTGPAPTTSITSGRRGSRVVRRLSR